MKHVAVTLVIILCCVTLGYCTKCMGPSDARYIMPDIPLPDDWKNEGWHTGDYFPSPSERNRFSKSPTGESTMFLTTQSNSAIMWWLKEQNFHTILSKDALHILCTLTGVGLHLSWRMVTDQTKRNRYCHWYVNQNGKDVEKFQIFNVELKDSLPDIGPVFLGRTGLYYDYDENSINDPSNAVNQNLTWWKWVKVNQGQREMSSLPNECQLDSNGIPVFEIEAEPGSEIAGRSLRRKKRFHFTSSGEFAKCKEKWFYNGQKCYRIFTQPPMEFARASSVCNLLGGTVALPSNADENRYLRQLIFKYSRSKRYTRDPLYYWLGAKAQAKPDFSEFFSLRNERLTFARWSRRSRRFPHQNCVMTSNGLWKVASCDSLTGRVLCERAAIFTDVPANVNCGKIQETGIDLVMKKEALTPESRKPKSGNRIVGGKNAFPTQFPWQAAIRFKNPIRIENFDGEIYHNCGGTLIDNCWVLSAGHCFNDDDPSHYTVRLGDVSKTYNDGSEQEFEIEKLIVHAQYRSSPTYINDISLIKLKKINGRCASFNNTVQPACLPSESFPIREEGEPCQVSGWGVTNVTAGQSSAKDILQWATVPTLKDATCEYRYNKKVNYFDSSKMFCAGLKRGGTDSCTGDSGGPYVCRGSNDRYAVQGVVSFGISCARKKYPGVYTRVKTYVPWIRNTIGEYGDGVVVS